MIPASPQSSLHAIDRLSGLIEQLERQAGETAQIPRQEWTLALHALRQDYLHLAHPEAPGKHLVSLPENNPFPVFQADADGKIQYANPACRALWQEGQVAIGQPLPEPLREMTRLALQDGNPREMELPLPDHVITFHIVPLAGQGCAHLYDFDVTQHKKNEERLRDSQEQLQTMLNSITEAYFVLDKDWRIVDYNPVAEREFLKLPKEKLVGKSFWETYPAAVGNVYYQQYHQSVASGEPVHFEALSALSATWYEVHAYPRDGRLEIYLHNINDRKQIEQEREDLLLENRRQKNLLEAVLHQMPAGILIAEAASGKILMSNRRIADIFRNPRPPGDMSDTTSSFQGFHPDGRPYRSDEWPLERSTHNGEVIQGEEIRIQRGDGSFGTISVNSSPIYDASGKIIAGVVIFFDITERKQAEQNASFLANLGERLLQLDEPDAIQTYATQALGEYLHLDRCILDEINLDEQMIQIHHDYSRGLPSIAGRFPFSGLHQQMRQAFGRGLVQVVSDTQVDPNTAPWFEPGLRALNICAYVAVPRYKEGAWKATLTAISNQPRPWRPEEISLLRSAGDLIWLALEGARVLKSLKDTTRRLDIALKNAPIIVHSLDCHLRYVWVYKPPENFRIEEVLGKRYDELVPPEEVAELMALKQKVLDCGVGTRQEVRLHLAGEEQIYDVTLEPLRDAAGQVIGLTVAGINITSQRKLEAEIRERAAQIEIQRQILRHRELERLEIARDLHDGPLQDMIGLNFAISEIALLEKPQEREVAIHHLQEMLQHQIQDVRTFCYELRPPALTPFGLERAIRSHLEHILKKNNHLQIHQNLMRDGKDLPEEIRLALYRVYQESMNNILRHSDASQVWLTFRYDEQMVELEINDDGKGFNVPFQWVQLAREGHLGVVGMHERVEAVGGTVQIDSTPGKGTRVRVTVKR